MSEKQQLNKSNIIVLGVGWVIILIVLAVIVAGGLGSARYEGSFKGTGVDGGDGGNGGGGGSSVNEADVTVEITYIAFDDDVDLTWLGDGTTEGEPVVCIIINGNEKESETLWEDQSSGYVSFSHTVHVSGVSSVDIRIELWEEDVDGYDHCDISASSDLDCEITYSLSTGKWSGDTTTGSTSGSDDGSGSYDEDDATVNFDVSH